MQVYDALAAQSVSAPSGAQPSKLPPLSVAVVSAETQGCSTPQGALRAIEKAVKSGADLVVAPEWLFVTKGKPAEFVSLMQQLKRITTGSKALVVPGTVAMCDNKGRYRNVAVAFSNGRALHTYAKRHDGISTEGWVALAVKATAGWKPGERSSLFEWRGFRVSIEICADHQHAAARDDLDRSGASAPDLQLVVAAGAAIDKSAVITREGGAVLCADGSPGTKTEAYRVRGNELVSRPEQRSERCGATTIRYLTL